MEKTNLYDSNGKVLTMDEVVSMLPPLTELHKVTRVEVIDENGRSYMNWNKNNHTTLSFQDNQRTLKVFISNTKR